MIDGEKHLDAKGRNEYNQHDALPGNRIIQPAVNVENRWLSRSLRDNSNLSKEPGKMNRLRSVPSLLYAYSIITRITPSAGEPVCGRNWHNSSGRPQAKVRVFRPLAHSDICADSTDRILGFTPKSRLT
jgi:hypothetical protein